MEAENKPKEGQHRGGRGRGGKRDQHERTKQPRRANYAHHGAGGKPIENNAEAKQFEHHKAGSGYGKQRQGNQNNRGGYNRRGNRGQRQFNDKNAPINASKDSYYYMYFYGPYPQVKEIEVTLETEIPTIKEDDILNAPSQEEYATKMKE